MDNIIRQLIEKEPTATIVLDDSPNIVIVPVVLDENSTADEDKIGQLEYQVSDGMPGFRSHSQDFYSWEDAKQAALDMEADLYTTVQ